MKKINDGRATGKVFPFLVAAATLLLVAAPSWAASPLLELSSPELFSNGSWSFGEIFTVGPQNVVVTALGAFDSEGNGFDTLGGIPVGLYNESDASLIVSSTVVSSDPLIGHYRYNNISPITLQSGNQYRVVAVSRDDLYNIDLNFTINPLVTYDGYGYVATTALTFGNTFTGIERVWMANLLLEAVPEPSSVALLALGAIGLVAGNSRQRSNRLRRRAT